MTSYGQFVHMYKMVRNPHPFYSPLRKWDCTSAEASMASGRIKAQPPILKTLSSPQSGQGLPSPYPCHRPGSASCPLRMVKTMVLSMFSRMGTSRTPKDPPRTSKDPQGPVRDFPQIAQGPKASHRTFQGPQMRPQEPPNAQNLEEFAGPMA